MKYLINIIFFLTTVQAIGQEYAPQEFYLIDSLVLEDLSESDRLLLDSSLSHFHNAKHDTDRVIILNNICAEMVHYSWRGYHVLADEIIYEKLKTAQVPEVKISLLRSMVSSLNHAGYIYSDENFDKAIECFKRATAIAQKLNYTNGIALSLNNLGSIYQRRGNISEALSCYNKSLKKEESIQNNFGIAVALNNIGLVYDEQKDTTNAIKYYKRSLAIGKEIKDENVIADAYHNLGGVYSESEDYARALNYYQECMKVREKKGDIKSLISTLNNTGLIYKKLGDLSIGKKYFERSLSISEQLNDYVHVAFSAYHMGSVEYEMNNLGKAEDYFKRALRISRQLSYPNMIKTCTWALSLLYEKKKDYEKAMEMFRIYDIVKDSINSVESNRAIESELARVEYEKQKQSDDIEHEQNILIQEKEKERLRILTYVSVIGVFLVVTFLFFVLGRLKVSRKRNKIIVEQKEDLESKKMIVEKAHVLLKEKNAEVMDSITFARYIQSSILPANEKVKKYLAQSFILYQPKDVVAGDFYWLQPSEDKVLFAVADCTGHGVPGAMVSVVCNNALNRSVGEFKLTDPGKILDRTKKIVVEEFNKSGEIVYDGMDIALCSIKDDVLYYAGANNPLWIVRDKELIEYKADKQPIGRSEENTDYKVCRIKVKKNDVIYLFSDGYADQFGGLKNKKFLSKSLRKLLISISSEDMNIQKDLLTKEFEEWKGENEQVDDICMIGVRI